MNGINRRDFIAAGVATGVCSTRSGLVFPYRTDRLTSPGPGAACVTPSWLGREPLIIAGCWDVFPLFQRRRGTVPVLLDELYKAQGQDQTIKTLKEAGVTLGIIHFFKGFGLAAEREHMADARLMAKRLKENGMRVGLYVGASIAYETFLAEVPEAVDWFVPDFMGKPVYYFDQTFRRLVYFMHPGYREYIRRVVTLGVQNFSADLIHFDNTALMAEPRVFQHPMAIRDFRKYLTDKFTPPELIQRFGFADARYMTCPYVEASPGHINDPLFQEFALFRVHLLNSYFAEMTSLIRSLNSEVAVNCNPHSGISGVNTIWEQGISYPGLTQQIDTMSTEEPGELGVTPEGILVSKIRTYKEAAILKKPIICYTGGGGLTGRGGGPRTSGALEMAESMIYNRQSLGEIGNFLDVPKLTPESRTYIRFFHENFELYREVEPVADVALLYSGSSMAWNNDRPAVSFMLASQMLIQSKFQFEIIFDEDLRNLSKYRVLFLADQECLSETQLDQIRSFVRNGGGLVATEHTSLYTERRERRPDFGLKDCFGITAPAWTGFFLPEVVLSTKPVRTEFGKGRVVYIPAIEPALEKPPAAPMDRKYWMLPRNNSDLVSAAQWAMRGAASVRVEDSLSPYVAMELLRQEARKRLILHVLNYDAARKSEISEIRVSVDASAVGRIASVRHMTPDRPDTQSLALSGHGDTISFVIPSLETYGVVVLAAD